MIVEPLKPTSDQLQKKNVYVVKMETTGLAQDDEILELCVIDARNPWRETPQGREPVPLFHARFKPEFHDAWPKAEQRHGISPASVADCKYMSEHQNALVPLFMHCDCVVAFNAEFVFAFLRRHFMFRPPIMTIDLMRDWTEYLTHPGGTREAMVNVPFQSQQELFEHFGWTGGRGALQECLGLRHCFLKLIPMSALHVRRPLQERRFARTTQDQLKFAVDSFQGIVHRMELGPTLHMREDEEGQLVVRIGLKDPERVYADMPFADVEFRVDPTGTPAEVRERILAGVRAQKSLPQGLSRLVCDVISGQRPTEEELREAEKEADTGKGETEE